MEMGQGKGRIDIRTKKGTFKKLINKSKKTKQATTKAMKSNMNKDNGKIAETKKETNKNARNKENRTAKNKATVDKEQIKIMFMATWNLKSLKNKEVIVEEIMLETEIANTEVELMVKNDKINTLRDIRNVNKRILIVKVRIEGRQEYWNLIVAYRPNEDEVKEFFYDELTNVIDNIVGESIVMGDLNCKVRKNNKGMEKYMGREREYQRDNNSRAMQKTTNDNR
ncbi:hypothetical protein ILUMI_19257 [Ignelater luminosus]|uniref:Endonuclease/exonuclease/phosphatase domain-containing protein n=1 Tax=Ignelater luminosus TaxID=2038154 RepID=A0A8K0CKW2_IGNLU|nr:hypothetical protein ILUMI_19257 [Ignelater luminosus]